MRTRTLFWIPFVLILAACSRNSAQDKFESDARKAPTGITRTDASGRILSNDPDDWRIGPMFQGFVDISVPAYPNPSQNQRITIDLIISGLESVNGIEVYTRTALGEPLFLYEIPDRPIPIGVSQIFFDPISLSPFRTYDNAIGIHRIYIYDRNGNLISYGDVEIE